MANLTTSGTSGYPGSIDTSTTLIDGAGGDEIIAENVNGPTAAAVNLETELGTNPKGTTADVKTRLNVSQNADGTIKSTVIAANTPTSVSYAAGVFTLTTTPARKLSGDVVQVVSVAVAGFTTTNGSNPINNNPFISTQGSGFGLSVNMLPTSTLNSVYVQALLHGTNSNNNMNVMGLFLAGSSSAIYAAPINGGAVNEVSTGMLFWKATTVSTATTTYAIRAAGSGGTFTLNGQAGAGMWADSLVSTLMVYEVQN